MEMRLLFLGTSAAVPTLHRNVTAVALQHDQRREWWLFDCGEGTQQQILRSELSISQVRRIFISHLHGDHCFGLPGLMSTRGFKGAIEPLDLYGPRGLRAFIDSIEQTTHTHFSAHTVHEISTPGVIFEDEEYLVHAVNVPHVGQTLCYVLEEKTRHGRFRAEEAQALGIRPGPVYARLKAGEDVTLDDGRVIQGKDLVDPPRAGRRVVLVFDTSDASAVLPLAQNADVMLHEATYLEGNKDLAENMRWGHSSAAGAARLAQQAGAQRLILSHISARYEQRAEDGAPTVKDLLAEAEGILGKGKVVVAKDFLRVDIPPRDAKPTTPNA